MKNKILILLASYNGGKFIREQLDSILQQSYTNWELLICDDGSTDNTLEIVSEYYAKDNRINVIPKDPKSQGASQNFGNLLKEALLREWNFVMFADQDDFWQSNKVKITLDAMLEMQDLDKSPRLVYCDFEYADGQMNALKSETDKNISNWKEPNLPRLLAQNNIYGCTMMLNRVLAEEVSPIPQWVENHDYWISLVASLTGEIYHVRERLMLYRQHSNNVSGHYSDNSFKKRFQRYYKKNDKLQVIVKGRFRMAEELFKRFNEEISESNRKLLVGYSDIEVKNAINRIIFCLKYGIKKDTPLQSCAFYYLLARM